LRVINQYLFQNPIPEPNQSIPNPELDWGLIGKELIMFIVIDCEFNQAHYSDIINQCFESPPSYAIVKEIEMESNDLTGDRLMNAIFPN